MPHHSTRSWASHMSSSPLREKMLNWRKRAGIRHRKDAGQRSESTPPRGCPSKSPAVPQRVDPFQIIASFFAQGNADSLSDEEVWRMKTSSSRTDSEMRALISPFEKRVTVHGVSGTPRLGERQRVNAKVLAKFLTALRQHERAQGGYCLYTT